jgi:flagellar hook-length control protein FliK
MIDRTLTNSMSVTDLVPKAATQLPSGHGDGAFSEALAGAHTVHDRRESQAADAADGSRRDWARSDHSADRTRGQDRADEVRSDRAARPDHDDDDDTKADATHGPTSTKANGTKRADHADDADATDATDAKDDAKDAATPVATAVAEAAAGATVAVAAAPVATDLDAIVVPTTTTAVTPTDAVDAAIRLSIDADATAAATTTVAAATTADAKTADATTVATTAPAPATATTTTTAAAAVTTTATAVTADPTAALTATIAQGAEDAATDDVKGPTRPTTSTSATTSGPSPVQLAASADVTVDAPTTQQAAQAADAPAVDVAAGTKTAAPVVQAAIAVEVEQTDATTAVEPTTDTNVVAKPGTVDTAPKGATAGVDVDVHVDAAPTVATVAPTKVQGPAIPVQAQAAAQAVVATEAASDHAGSANAPKADSAAPPLSTAQPVAAGTRDAQLAAGVRVREGVFSSSAQARIDNIAEQLATRLRLSHAAGGTHVNLSLKPRELGEVTVHMNVRDGAVAATILVDKADTLDTMQTNIEDLKKSLENQGLVIQEFSVDVRGEAGAGGANARAAADLRGSASRTSTGSASSIAGAEAVIPGLSGSRVVSADEVHDGDVSVLA